MRGNWLERDRPEPVSGDAGLTWLIVTPMIFFCLYCLYFYPYYVSSHWQTVDVTRVEIIKEYDGYYGARYMVHTRQGTFECAESVVFSTSAKEKRFKSLKPGTRYSVKIVGWDCETLGWHKNIITVNET